MKITFRRWSTGALAAGLLAFLAGCVATVGGYDSMEGSYGVGYYEPYGHVYGAWPSSYHVAPPRRDRDRDAQIRSPREGSRSPRPAYRPAPPSRGLPSLPSLPRPH
jgi:hypothetical protein